MEPLQGSGIKCEWDSHLILLPSFELLAFQKASPTYSSPSPVLRKEERGVHCNNCLYQKRETVYDHLLDNEIDRNYVRWLMHGKYKFYERTNTGNSCRTPRPDGWTGPGDADH